MAQLTRLILMTTAAGAMLSGCSLIGSVTDTAWSGTKTVAKWVSAPVRYVLRGSPETDTQFAGAALETEEPIVPVEGDTVLMTEAASVNTHKVKAEPMVMQVSTVNTAPVTTHSAMSQTQAMQSATLHTASYQTLTRHSQTTSQATSMTTAQQGASILTRTSGEQADWEGPIRYSVETSSRGDLVHFVRLKGMSSMSDWMDCDRSADGYWLTGDKGGVINPAFEVCMRGLDYVLETERASYNAAAAVAEAAAISAPSVADARPQLAGGSDRPALRSSSYVPTQEQRSDLPHKF